MIELQNKKYTFWELLNEVGIKIPIIQRDYAQGRENKQAQDIRENFLNNLLEVLNSETKIDLDFVYGTVKDGYLILLDGQQRLTTLFLLHYFLVLKDEKLNEDTKKILTKFTYETRLSSREFIKLLINNTVNLKEEEISTTIKNQTWFFSDWENDPTIKSMLKMLDSVQDKFKNEKGLFEKLISKKHKQITFSFLPLDEFKLTDELYIKMNARGKPLSEFENFKSNFEKFLNNEEKKAKLDNEWYDIFWNLRKEKDEDSPAQRADELFLNFFKNITAFYSKEFNRVDIFKFIYTEKIDDICKVLDCLTSYQDNHTDEIRRDLNILQNFLKNPKDISYAERLKFYMLMVFFLKKGLPSESQETFKSWARVNINIIHNIAYDNIKDFENSIKFINNLGEHIDNLYEFLSENDFGDNISEQLKEEIEKATIIEDEKHQHDWEKDFLNAENHNYLDGEVKFLIKISAENEISEDNFKKYMEKFQALWEFASVKEDKKENEMLLHRALLTFGNYLPHKKNSNKYTFGSFGLGLREKNENWRRIFEKEEFKKLLDELNYEDIKQELTSIINSFEFNCNDWRSYFINPNKKWTPISYANYYHIQINNNAIFLNNGWSSSKATGWGWSRVYEMHSIYLLQHIQEKLNSLEPFLEIYPHPSSDIKETYPHIAIKNWKNKDNYSFEINIIYNEKYIIEFFEKNNKQIPNKIMDTLKTFDIDNETYDITVYKNEEFELCKQNDLVVFLENLLKTLKAINIDTL
ncbi:DUF262 domain-containing protein [Sulfurimonas paralvinellae]|uniref:DUF262 domain-containing protein n=1 Tax=Sulfurimonas paralvinellae TaxID=317658 RepID=A0A7M1B884_9BACT|nr:DUF262 domain-containing protein [Sulfurimonas paralvinellae]QOP45885.1 DUF262 domain-containing protein [Sulfurimonas paralvinellae]